MRRHWKAILGTLLLIGLAVGIAWPTIVASNNGTNNAVTNELAGAGYTSVLTQDYAHGNGQFAIWEETTCRPTTNGLVTIGTNYTACAGGTILSKMTPQTPGFVVCMSDGDPKKIMDILVSKKPDDLNTPLYYDAVNASAYDPNYLNRMSDAIQLLHQSGDKTSSIALGTSSTADQIGVVAQGDLAELVANQCTTGS